MCVNRVEKVECPLFFSGDGSTSERWNPVVVCASGSGPNCSPLGNVRALAVGYAHTCALLNDGQLRCWGYNDSGQLGDGTTWSPRLNPVSVCAEGICNADELTPNPQGTIFTDAVVHACGAVELMP